MGYNVTGGVRGAADGEAGRPAEPGSVTGTTDTLLYSDASNTVEYQGTAQRSSHVADGNDACQRKLLHHRRQPDDGIEHDGDRDADNLDDPGQRVSDDCARAVVQDLGGPSSATNWLSHRGEAPPIAGVGIVLTRTDIGVQIDWNPAASYKWRACTGIGLGDGVNAVAAATYPVLGCVNNSGSTLTVAAIHCYTDNNGSSTLDVKNNAGTSLLAGPITCSNTKTSGGAAGTLGGTTTIATTDAFNFVFISDGTTKSTTWTVDVTLP